MAHRLPNVSDGVHVGHLLAMLSHLGIVPSAEQANRLNELGNGLLTPVVTGVTISVPGAARVTIPVIDISDDEDEGIFPDYPVDEGTDLDDVASMTGADDAHVPPSTNATPATNGEPITQPAADATDTGGEDEEPQPGTYLECKVCGTLFDLVPRKSGQPWHVVFVGRTVGIFRSFIKATEQVTGISKGFRRRFKTQKAAEAAFISERDAGNVKVRFSNKEMGAASNAVQEVIQQAEVGSVLVYI